MITEHWVMLRILSLLLGVTLTGHLANVKSGNVNRFVFILSHSSKGNVMEKLSEFPDPLMNMNTNMENGN